MSLGNFLWRVTIIIEKWAEQRNPVRIDYLNFADEPLLTPLIQIAANMWSTFTIILKTTIYSIITFITIKTNLCTAD